MSLGVNQMQLTEDNLEDKHSYSITLPKLPYQEYSHYARVFYQH